MNKKEMQTILGTYKQIFHTHTVLRYDKADTVREFKFMLDSLNLKKERYIVENEVIAESKSMKSTVKSMYEMIFEDFAKYGRYINYDLEEIGLYYDNLQYELTEEENKCHVSRVNYIKEYETCLN